MNHVTHGSLAWGLGITLTALYVAVILTFPIAWRRARDADRAHRDATISRRRRAMLRAAAPWLASVATVTAFAVAWFATVGL